MREPLARLAAAITAALLLLLSLAFAGVQQARAQAADSALVARGRVVYREQRCAVCHSVAGVGNRRVPLDSAGRLDTLTLRHWIVAPARVRPGVRKRAYDHLPEPDVRALIAWLRTLRADRRP